LAFVAEHLRDLLFSVKLDHSLFLCCVGWQIPSSSLAMGGDYTNANEGASQTDASSIRRCVGVPDRAARTALPRCCKRQQPIEVVRRRVNWAAQPVRGSGVYLLNKLLRSTL